MSMVRNEAKSRGARSRLAKANLAGFQRKNARSQLDGFECKHAQRYARVARDHRIFPRAALGAAPAA
jgi:hypothetical protein